MKRVRANTKPSASHKAPPAPPDKQPVSRGKRAPRPQSHYTRAPAILLPKHREFARLAATRGVSDPIALARDAGFKRPSDGPSLLLRLRDLIERERLANEMGAPMQMEEALRVVGDLARTADDLKIKLAATRTVLEIHGALGTKGAVPDRSEFARSLEKLVSDIRGKSRQSKTGGRTRVAIAIEHDDGASAAPTVSHTPSSAADNAADVQLVRHTADRARED